MLRPSTTKKVYRKVKKTLFVDSRDRSPAQTQSNYSVTLPKVYENVYAVSLRSAEIPKSWYSFSASSGNTSLSLTINGGSVQTVTIADGNYTSATLATELARVLNALSSGTFTVAVSGTTGLITISHNSNDFVLKFADQVQQREGCGSVVPIPATSAWWGLGYFLGFNKIDYSSSSNTLTGAFPVQYDTFNYILMELDFINKADETAIDDRMSGRVDGVFAKIPLAPASAGSVVYFREWGVPLNRSVLSPPLGQLRKLNIRFRTHDGKLVEFNNADHALTLDFELLENGFDEYSSLEFAPL